MTSATESRQREQRPRRFWSWTLFRICFAVIICLIVVAGVASYFGGYSSHSTTQTLTATTTRTQSTIILTPRNGAQGDVIAVSGSGYLSAVEDCTSALTTNPPNLFNNGVATSCTIDAKHNLTGEFAVASDASPGAYTIALIGSFVAQGTVSTPFTLTTKMIPTIAISPSQGSGGDNITFTGSGFNPDDASCVVIFYQMEQTLQTESCHLAAGSVNGWFTVKASGNPAGAREVRVTGNLLDTANALFTVTPKIVITPNPATLGDELTVSGSNFVVPGDCSNVADWLGLPAGVSVERCIINENFLISATLLVSANVNAADYPITLTDGLVQASVNLTIQLPTAAAPPNFIAGTCSRRSLFAFDNPNKID
jgi:hypothetical protein